MSSWENSAEPAPKPLEQTGLPEENLNYVQPAIIVVLVIAVIALVILVATKKCGKTPPPPTPPQCITSIFCNGTGIHSQVVPASGKLSDDLQTIYWNNATAPWIRASSNTGKSFLGEWTDRKFTNTIHDNGTITNPYVGGWTATYTIGPCPASKYYTTAVHNMCTGNNGTTPSPYMDPMLLVSSKDC